MVLLVQTAAKDEVYESLLQKIEQVVPPAELKEFGGFDELFHFLVGSLGARDILVLLASSRETLVDFRRLGDLGRDIQILLVLPDWQAETLSLAHQLHPRYLTYQDSSFDDMASVLQKILARGRQKEAAFGRGRE